MPGARTVSSLGSRPQWQSRGKLSPTRGEAGHDRQLKKGALGENLHSAGPDLSLIQEGRFGCFELN